MKKQLTAAALLLALALCRTAARAGGGDAGDPLISRSYLEGAFSQSIAAAADSRADESGRTLRAAVRRRLEAMKEGFLASGQRTAAMNPGGTLSGSTGLSVTPLAGELTLTRGTAVDVTAGREIAAGEKLAVNHRCVVAEGSSAVFTAGTARRGTPPDSRTAGGPPGPCGRWGCSGGPDPAWGRGWIST